MTEENSGIEIDWGFATSVANTVSRLGDSPGNLPDADILALSDVAKQHVADYTGLPVPPPVPVTLMERGDWIGLNLGGLRTSLAEPLAKIRRPSGGIGSVLAKGSSYVLATELGGALGYFSTRVLGQYHFVLGEKADPQPQLIFVRPNLITTQHKLDVEAHDFLLWICLHELTHAFQFSGSSWLRDELGRLFDRFMQAALQQLEGPPGRGILDSLKDPQQVWEKLREGAIIELIASPAERELIARVQTIMTIVEGHAEHVMHALGARLLPSYPKMQKMVVERSRRSAPERLLQRLLGLDLKIKQYARGRQFVDTVVAETDMDTFNRILIDPEALPTAEELDSVEKWLQRMSS